MIKFHNRKSHWLVQSDLTKRNLRRVMRNSRDVFGFFRVLSREHPHLRLHELFESSLRREEFWLNLIGKSSFVCLKGVSRETD